MTSVILSSFENPSISLVSTSTSTNSFVESVESVKVPVLTISSIISVTATNFSGA